MKLSREQLVQAIALALNDHIPMGQTRTQVNSDWKGLADSEAERNAVFATQLARAGLTGPAPIFEGRKGFFQMVATPAEVNVEAFGNATAKFKILQSGVKVYPAVVYAQTAIVAGLALARRSATSTGLPRSRSPPTHAATNRPAAIPRSGRRRTATLPTTACPILPSAPWSMATSPTQATRPTNCAIRRSWR